MSATPSAERVLAALEGSSPLPRRQALLCLALAALASGERALLLATLQEAQRAGVPREDVEEILLQGVLFGGFPRTVEAFQALRGSWGPRDPGRAAAEPASTAGAALFDRIYADLAPAVRAELQSLHSALAHWIAEHAYRAVLARAQLDAAARELAAVTALAATDCERQLLSHARGALRCGASTSEVQAALRLAGLFRSSEALDALRAKIERALRGIEVPRGEPPR